MRLPTIGPELRPEKPQEHGRIFEPAQAQSGRISPTWNRECRAHHAEKNTAWSSSKRPMLRGRRNGGLWH
jgi:hypothetical protein